MNTFCHNILAASTGSVAVVACSTQTLASEKQEIPGMREHLGMHPQQYVTQV